MKSNYMNVGNRVKVTHRLFFEEEMEGTIKKIENDMFVSVELTNLQTRTYNISSLFDITYEEYHSLPAQLERLAKELDTIQINLAQKNLPKRNLREHIDNTAELVYTLRNNLQDIIEDNPK